MKKLNPKLKAGCGVIFVFGLGFFTGLVIMFALILGIVQKTEDWRTHESRDIIARHFGNQLELDEAQFEKFRPIVGEILDRRWQMRKDYLIEGHEVIEDEYFPRIAEFLTEKQKAKAAILLKRWRWDNAAKLKRLNDKESPVEPEKAIAAPEI